MSDNLFLSLLLNDKAKTSQKLTFKEFDNEYRLTFKRGVKHKIYLLEKQASERFSVEHLTWSMSYKLIDMEGHFQFVPQQELLTWLNEQLQGETKATHIKSVSN